MDGKVEVVTVYIRPGVAREVRRPTGLLVGYHITSRKFWGRTESTIFLPKQAEGISAKMIGRGKMAGWIVAEIESDKTLQQGKDRISIKRFQDIVKQLNENTANNIIER